jgi:hypothetical protein
VPGLDALLQQLIADGLAEWFNGEIQPLSGPALRSGSWLGAAMKQLAQAVERERRRIGKIIEPGQGRGQPRRLMLPSSQPMTSGHSRRSSRRPKAQRPSASDPTA